MSKVAIVFWSATGNTETMANCIAEGCRRCRHHRSLRGHGPRKAGRV